MFAIFSGKVHKITDTDSSSSTILTTVIENIVERLRCCKYQSTPKKYYLSVWRNFNEFFIRLDRKPKTWEDRLVLFVGFLVENKRKSTTIKSYISAIRAVLADDGVTLNEDKYLLKALTKACKLQNDHIRTRLPISKGILQILFKYI